MKISVITVCRNSAKTIAYTIESFLRQTHAEKELIIVDGASTDETLAIIAAVAATGVSVISEPDHGMYDAANKGLAKFTGDAVGFLNSDDRYADENAVAAIAEGLAEADIVFGNLDFVTNHAAPEVVRSWRGSAFRRGDFRRGWMPAHPTFYVRRRVVEAVAGFDTRYRIAADYDFMLRALELHEFRTAFVDQVLVHMMRGGESTAGLGAHLKHNYEALYSRRQWLGAGILDYSLFAKPLRKLPQMIPTFRASRIERVAAADSPRAAGVTKSEPRPSDSSRVRDER